MKAKTVESKELEGLNLSANYRHVLITVEINIYITNSFGLT